MFPDVSWCKRVGRIKYRTLVPMTSEDPRGSEFPPIVIEVGFLFEVSSHFPANLVVNPHDEGLRRAALFHDYALHVMEMEREYADLLLYRLAIDDGTSELKARVIRKTATRFGWRYPSKKAVQSA